jgi:hypothetical protein
MTALNISPLFNPFRDIGAHNPRRATARQHRIASGKTVRFVLAVLTALTLTACSAQPRQATKATALQSEALTISPAVAAGMDGLRSGALFDALAQMDSILFDASFVSCDAAKANAIFTDDVEFYHDQTGLAVGEQVRENTRRLTASCPRERGIKRTIVPGSLRVYPIEGYGAVQMGLHRFDERGVATATLAKFVNVWRLQDGRSQLARVLSFDHHAVPAHEPSPPQ